MPTFFDTDRSDLKEEELDCFHSDPILQHLIDDYISGDSQYNGKKRPRVIDMEPLENVGKVSIKHIVQTCDTEIILHTLSLLDPSNWSCYPPAPPLVLSSHFSKMQLHALISQGAIRYVDQRQIKSYIHSFLVTKSNSLGRFIGHPKHLNGTLQNSPFSLSSSVSLLRCISEYFDSTGVEDMYCTESDFKNFFPQIPLPCAAQDFFGIYNVDEYEVRTYAVMRVLTQGWDKSTIISQAVSWATLLPQHEEDIQLDLHGLHQIPGMLVHRCLSGIIIFVVVYDNILCVCSNRALQLKITAQLRRNARTCNIKFKYIHESVNTFKFCGITCNFDTSDNGTPKTIKWKINDDVFEKWQSVVQEVKVSTPRQVMQLFGYLSRMRFIQLNTLTDVHSIRGKISEIACEMQTKNHQAWRKTSDLAKAAGIELKLILATSTNCWTSVQHRLIANPLIIVTDASDDKLGYVVYKRASDSSFVKLCCRSQKRTDGESIDVGEAQAVFLAIVDIISLEDFDSLVICIDNTAVSRALFKAVSKSHTLDVIIQKVWVLILSKYTESNVAVCDIASADNVADVMTRDEDLSSSNFSLRQGRTWSVALQAINNLNCNIRWTPRMSS